MKTLIGIVIAAAVGFATGYAVFNRVLREHETELVLQQAAWQMEKEKLESALAICNASHKP